MKKALRNKESKEIIDLVEQKFGLSFSKKQKFERDEDIILIDDVPSFFYYKDMLLPTLKLLMGHSCLKKITVDMGAVRFVAKGADIMRPGITNIEGGILEKEFVAIVDETHGKPLAIGRTMFSGTQMGSMETGKVIKNIHYVGDEIWNYH